MYRVNVWFRAEHIFLYTKARHTIQYVELSRQDSTRNNLCSTFAFTGDWKKDQVLPALSRDCELTTIS